jgi:hypothetical protein
MPIANAWNSVPLLVAALLLGCAHRGAITGQVVDRNGGPMERVVVTVEPGGVEIVTDTEGRFQIDYMRDEAGNRVGLAKKTEYRIEVWKPGYHITRSSLSYRSGHVVLEPITLVKDTIRVNESADDLDPADRPDRTHSAGTNYEGE